MFTYIQEVVKKRRIFIDNQLLDLKMTTYSVLSSYVDC